MSDWWRGSVTYQVYPRSFQDDNGDGIGDLRGITRRLGHIADLGCDAVWLSPVFPSPMRDMGYDVSDYCGIEPTFGTLADFDALLAEAHRLGLKVIIDQVLSHSSDLHPFFAESRRDRTNPKADWYVWADPQADGTPPNNWLSVFGGPAWTWDARRKQYYFHNFLAEQPDLNFHNPEVRAYMEGVLRFWLERGVDGFRIDTVNYFFHDARLRNDPADFRVKAHADANPYEMQYHLFSKSQPENLGWLEQIRQILDSFPDRTSVGEVGDSHHALRLMGDYTAPGRLHQCYSFEMFGTDYTPSYFRRALESFFNDAPNGWPMWAFSNHDVTRHATRWAPHGHTPQALARQACALLLSFRGSICLWQGEELGQTDTALEFHELTDPVGINFWPEPGRDGTRTPMVWDAGAEGGFSRAKPWLPVKAPQLARNVASQTGIAGSVLEFYREMIAFRRQTSALHGPAAMRFLDLPEPVFGHVRGAGDEAVLCLFNLSPQPVVLQARDLGAAVGPAQAVGLEEGLLRLGPNGFGFFRAGDGFHLSAG